MTSKTGKSTTFAGQLRHFAQSVDIVDGGRFDNVRDLVYRYVLREPIGAVYFELLHEQWVGDHGDRRSFLQTFWTSQDPLRHSWQVYPAAGRDSNPITEAFAYERPMWIVSSDRGPLAQSQNGSHTDLWSHSTDLPAYRPVSNAARTVVILPLIHQRRVGIYCLESPRYIDITDVAKLELSRLGDALAMLYGLWEVNKAQLTGTEQAIGDLREGLQRAKFPRLSKPHVFLAFSQRADESVRLAIDDVLNGFDDKLEFTDWSKMNEAGNITTQIAREIVESRFGICYFSEPDDTVSGRYRDNPNVVFEAGMLHARTAAVGDTDFDEPAGWIPIREVQSPPAPFDFAAERILYVPRSRGGELYEARLREMLTRRINDLLREE
ncbi:MAG TPA: TIR domain-containing protein [Propionibacteriaceae bacterium]